MTSEIGERGGPLDEIIFDGAGFVISGDNDEVLPQSPSAEKFRETIVRLVPAEKLHHFLLRSYGWAGTRYQLESLRVDPEDEMFREACNELYADLKASALGPWVDKANPELLEKIVLYGFGFGSPIYGAYGELQERKNQLRSAAEHGQEIDATTKDSSDE